jgi:hypothetical protein
VAAIPYAEMWADDVLWLPRLLAGAWFSGRFVFDGEDMCDQEVHDLSPEERAELQTTVSRNERMEIPISGPTQYR